MGVPTLSESLRRQYKTRREPGGWLHRCCFHQDVSRWRQSIRSSGYGASALDSAFSSLAGPGLFPAGSGNGSSAIATVLTPEGRRRFIQVYQRRRNQIITHPQFGYEITVIRAIESQARQLAKVVTGELDLYRGLVVR